MRVAAVLFPVLVAMLVYGEVTGNVFSFIGGFNWQTALFAFWEQVFAVSVSIGLIGLFRQKVNFQNRFMKFLSDNSYAAFILQAPVLIGLALGLAFIKMPLALKFLIVAPIGVALCFLAAFLVRKIPGVNRVL